MMKQKLILITGAALAFVLVFSACSNTASQQEGNSGETIEERVFPIEVQTIQKESIERTLEYTANLYPFTEIHLAPASPGRISEIKVEVGSRVRKGLALVEMDKTNLNQARTQLANARYNFSSIDTLYQLGSISEQQYEQAKTQFEVAKSNVKFLKENTTLESPINGIVTGKYYENGEIYSATPNPATGKAAILSLMQINPLKAMVSISQTYYPDIKQGMKATITTDIYPDKTFEGTVYKVHPTIDQTTRTFQIEVTVKNNNEILRPGMFANIEITINEEETLVVPAIAVLKQEGTNNRYVFINNNGTAKQVTVTIGKRMDDKIELVANGVQEGAALIVEGQANLMNGSKVKIAN